MIGKQRKVQGICSFIFAIDCCQSGGISHQGKGHGVLVFGQIMLGKRRCRQKSYFCVRQRIRNFQGKEHSQQYLGCVGRSLSKVNHCINLNMLTLIRYTRVVDQYIPIMANCLKDSDKQLRWQSLIILTNLLHVRLSRISSIFFAIFRRTISNGRVHSFLHTWSLQTIVILK